MPKRGQEQKKEQGKQVSVTAAGEKGQGKAVVRGEIRSSRSYPPGPRRNVFIFG